MKEHTNRRRIRNALLGAVAVTLPLGATAQAQEGSEQIALSEEIVVTGSRIARDEFTSAVPLQVFDVEAARQLGITSVTELLQRSTIANGAQFNGTLNTNSGASNASEPPAPGGVGSANVGLRGLDPERTLVLINGRRLGSSGVRGAPSQPDINLIPLGLVERVEVITEGASAVYGADAVAGVVNVILRDDFEGLEVTVGTDIPFNGGGETTQVSFVSGAKTDRGSFTLSGEYFDRKRVSLGDREDCFRPNREIGEDGTIYDNCQGRFPDNLVVTLPSLAATGDIFSFWYSEGNSTEEGIPNFVNSTFFPEPTGTGASQRVDERDRPRFFDEYWDNDERLASDLVTPITRFSTLATGSYELETLGMNEEVYFEAVYSNRHLTNIATIEQLIPTIPQFIRQEDANGNIIVDGAGNPILVDNPLNPFDGNVIPVVTLQDANQNRRTELQHFRFVGGMRGDLPGETLQEKNWTFDAAFTYDRGTGFVSQTVVNEDRLLLSLATQRLDANGNVVCGHPPIPDILGEFSPVDCVVIDWFAPSIYANEPGNDGRFATDAERDFLIAQRLNRTVVQQAVASAFVTGELFDLPAGPVATALGVEWRKDSIFSDVEVLGSSGAVLAENPLQEGATVGSRKLFEAYGEFVVPLIADMEMVELLEAEGAVRWTEESNFGAQITTRARLTYKPNDWITISGSYGTSFRAPNLREQFLADQFGSIGGTADPCRTPDEAVEAGVYFPELDTRSQTVIDNCLQSGADPTQLGLQATTSIPVVIGGNPDSLKAETSDSFTATLAVSPPISDKFDVDFAVSFFDITVKDTVRSIEGDVIMRRCFEDAPNLSSPFCDRLTRQSTGFPFFNFIEEIDASFVNVGRETSQGLDFNTRLRWGYDDVLGAPLDVVWSGAITFQTDRTEQIFEGGQVDDLLGEFGTPKRRLTSTISLMRDNWEFLWETRHLSGTTAAAATLPQACQVFDNNTSINSPDLTIADCSAEGRWYHDAALTYRMDTAVISLGINNVFDKSPPRINNAPVGNRGGRVTSAGYDQIQRSFFLNVTKAF